MLGLLVASVAINYIDRGNLSIAAPMLKDELGITAAQLGILLSSFFWTYASFQLVSGWLVDRLDPSWVLAAGFLLWSAATAGAGLVQGFGVLLFLRLVLGIGESVAYPCYSKIMIALYPENRRGFGNALIDAGTKIGPAIGTLFGGLLMARFGWRPFFIVLGLASLIWLPFWFQRMPRGQAYANSGTAGMPGVLEMLRLREAWATFLGHFCGNYLWYFLLTWLPFYLVRERRFSMDSMATLGALCFLVTASATTASGWISDRAVSRGITLTRVRKTCLSGGLACATVVLGVAAVSDLMFAIVFLMLACISYGVFASSIWATSQTLAGPLAAGRWTGMQNFISNLAGVAAPAITGLVVHTTGQFFWAFVVVAGIVLAGSAVYLFGLRSVEPVRWDAGKHYPSGSKQRPSWG